MNNISLKGKSFLTLKDFTKEEIRYLLTLSSYLKTKKKSWHKRRFATRKKYSFII